MPAFEFEDIVVIPASVTDRESFNRWALSRDFPERGQFAYLNGRVWADLDMEAEDHNLIKMAIGAVLTLWVHKHKLGRYYGDRMMISNARARLSTEPDGVFVSNETRRANRIRVRGGKVGKSKGVILIGTPDMVLEVVSPSSVRKDTKRLMELYWRAGVLEYWLVNPLGDELEFVLYSRTASGFRAVRAVDGWRKSSVFGGTFRLVQSTDELGLPTYQLEVR